MQAYTELAAPTAVSHSLTLPLTSPTANNLVVAKGSLLQIFTTKTIAAELDDNTNAAPNESGAKPDATYDGRANDDDGLESSFLGGGESLLVRADRSQHTKLVLVAEIPLAGTVIGMARIKLPNTASGGEGLLLAYKAAKLCLTEWDPRRRSLETLSLHYYEKDDLPTAPWELPLDEYVNHLEADPGSRCAVFKFGPRSLAILPFRQSEQDLEMDDWDDDLDGPRPAKPSAEEAATDGEKTNGDKGTSDPAYAPSFVLRLPMLDPSLLHPVHLAFLHEYREPTFGILSAARPPSASLNATDYLTYKVFTLDLQQQASTTILSVTDLPRDLFRVMPLPAPLGGALLVGENELIHIDQSGKPNGVAVNPMTKQVTSFNLVDQSDLTLRLEGCTIEPISVESGEFLIVLSDGRLALCLFHIDGRTVTGISIKMVPVESGGHLVKNGASCVSKLPGDAVFIGSESNDALVLGWTRKQTQDKRKKTHADLAALDLDDDVDLDDVEEDDDLYGNDSGASKPSAATVSQKSGDLTFRIHDSLLSLAPIHDAACGKPAFVPGSEAATLAEGVTANLELTCAVGSGRAGSLAVINREIQPRVIGRFDFPEARGFWTMRVKRPGPKALAGGAAAATAPAISEYDADDMYDRYMIVAKVDLDGYETSDVYALTAAGFEGIKGTEFEPAAGFTVEAGVMGNQMRVIQVLKSEVRIYDGDLGLAQILPMLDEETGAEPRVLSASIADPFLLLIRDDGSILVEQMDASNELDEVVKPAGAEALSSNKWTAGCLYKDKTAVFQEEQGDKGGDVEKVMMFLLNSAGALYVYALPDLSKPVYVAEGLSCTPQFLSADLAMRKGAPRETLSQILVADLGDAISQTPHLIVGLPPP